jgi:hypothetical protein
MNRGAGQPRPINLQQVRWRSLVVAVFCQGSPLDRGVVGQIVESQAP